ncbi:hypothetical protein [Paenibacillus sp. FSL R7-0331]|uniref:hypothetical protein n=1 Tax=Paenibacillus sp. FSL R7-0331 TaxID=1536773 RepID=UPI0004F69FE8|nr:hypothetical protein [Paenibacillus sp. FSL R7-0331]AIQ53442.1 hypothetical protein R70331_19190 [Paenibacillus sp. FSL R7-0331]
MKVKILFILLSVSLVINAVLFYGLTKYELVEKGSANRIVDSLELPASESVLEEENTYSSNAANGMVDMNLETESPDNGYIYYLTDDKIIQAIDEGAKDTAYYGEDFMLPIPLLINNDRMFENMGVFIETPYSNVALYSSNQYAKYNNRASIDDVMSLITYNYITFSAYVMEGTANMLDTELIQDGTVIKSYKTDNNAIGDVKTIRFSVDAIDFREPAVLRIFEKSNPANYTEFQISFEDYVK